VCRHATASKRAHWHIDYLLAHARLTGVHSVVDGERLECTWAAVLLGLPGAYLVARGFGASDCRCPTHLVHFSGGMSTKLLRLVLTRRPRQLVENLLRSIAAQDDEE
jgi:Uri superfamily endonuclease